jgi:predicted flap endonuclease-1-like 5' DNA nuclease
MIKDWLNDDIFKTWNAAQKRFWESFSSVVPVSQAPQGMMDLWRETYLKNLAIWETAVKQTLLAEAAWIEQWTKRTTGDNTPEAMVQWAQQMENVLRYWLRNQNQLWDSYFTMLRDSSARFFPPSSPTATSFSTSTEPVTTEPDTDTLAAEAAELLAETAAEPDVEALAAATAPPAPQASPAPQQTPTQLSEKDDLRQISGIGPAIERKLNAEGITHYRQIAELSDADIERLEKTVIKSGGRIRRDDWPSQAKTLYAQKYKENW